MEHYSVQFNLVLINQNFVLLCLMLLVKGLRKRYAGYILEINSLFHRSPVLFSF